MQRICDFIAKWRGVIVLLVAALSLIVPSSLAWIGTWVINADVLVIGSPVYDSFPTGMACAHIRETRFPQDLQNAHDLGKRLVEKAKE